MWPEQEMNDPQNQQAGGDPNALPPYDPNLIEQARQEIELAHEEFQRLLSGRSRRHTPFRW